MNQSLYRDDILEYSRNGRYAGTVAGATHRGTLENVLCGDAVSWTIRLNEVTKTIAEAKFEVDGCALSAAGAAAVAQAAQGRTITQLKRLNPAWLRKRLNINPGPAREKCVTLGLEAFHATFER
ncbi:iron-sulfur cluster assembly scaffold protein [Candidatus Berkelbacteria bacterium]|nr:iron-sulfur cluster assembly scaffold protein [Candidatus Berkelbacteria bacterium]